MLCPWQNQPELWSLSEAGGFRSVVMREVSYYHEIVKKRSYYIFGSYYADGLLNFESLVFEVAEAKASNLIAVALSFLYIFSIY